MIIIDTAPTPFTLPSPVSTDFRITRAFEADLAEYGDESSAAAALVLGAYDALSDLVAAGRLDEASAIVAMFPV